MRSIYKSYKIISLLSASPVYGPENIITYLANLIVIDRIIIYQRYITRLLVQ